VYCKWRHSDISISGKFRNFVRILP
jgi:hypothetical protein